LLASLGIPFIIDVPSVDERRQPGEAPAVFVERVARAKAAAVAGVGRIVLAADTTVVVQGHLLGKPAHPDEAKAMLRRLAGVTHQVLTGVVVASVEEVIATVESTLVRFVPMTEDEISDYVSTGEPMDKAGAYALQGKGAVFVESVQGSPSNVVGLPLHATARLLRRVGVELFGVRAGRVAG
jgi:septum formation protein